MHFTDKYNLCQWVSVQGQKSEKIILNKLRLCHNCLSAYYNEVLCPPNGISSRNKYFIHPLLL